MTWAELRALGLALPGVEEATSYGTPALKIRGKLLVRLHETGADVVLHAAHAEKELLLEADPDRFHQTSHYEGWPALLARLAPADPAQITAMLERRWRELAGRRAALAWEARRAACQPAPGA